MKLSDLLLSNRYESGEGQHKVTLVRSSHHEGLWTIKRISGDSNITASDTAIKRMFPPNKKEKS
jgi:hypothetical protein